MICFNELWFYTDRHKLFAACNPCQLLTQVSGDLRQSINISKPFYNGQTKRIVGTEIAIIRISSGRPMRQ
jgi:hypothetical protein